MTDESPARENVKKFINGYAITRLLVIFINLVIFIMSFFSCFERIYLIII